MKVEMIGLRSKNKIISLWRSLMQAPRLEDRARRACIVCIKAVGAMAALVALCVGFYIKGVL